VVHERDMSSGAAVVALLEKEPELRREIAVNLYKNGDVSLWSALEIDRRLSVCHALLSMFTKTLV
jgi:predicted HTH domain antitoxin